LAVSIPRWCCPVSGRPRCFGPISQGRQGPAVYENGVWTLLERISRNSGTTAINGWTLTFAYTGNQTLTSGWAATWTQSGKNLTATSLSYNGALAPGASTSIGFNANYSGTNVAPTAFKVNGVTCT